MEDDDFGNNDILMEDLEPLNPFEDRLTGAIRNIQRRYIVEKEIETQRSQFKVWPDSINPQLKLQSSQVPIHTSLVASPRE